MKEFNVIIHRLLPYVATIATMSTMATALHHMPPTPEGLSFLESNLVPGAKMSYKETSICETTPDVKAWAGYIQLPASPPLQNDTENLFFWYFQSRSSPSSDPLAVFIEGVGGVPDYVVGRYGSYDDAGGIGPCISLANSIGTEINPWSITNEANVLFLDHIPDAGFAYVETRPVAEEWNLLWDDNAGVGRNIGPQRQKIAHLAEGEDGGVNWARCEDGKDYTFQYHGDGNATAWSCGVQRQEREFSERTSTSARARTIWRFFQAFFEVAPFHTGRAQGGGLEMSFWGYIYGAESAAVWSEYFVEQSKKIADGQESGLPIKISGLGLIEGQVDAYKQMLAQYEYFHENIWGIRKINDSLWQTMQEGLEKCTEIYQDCQAGVELYDSQRLGMNESVLSVCARATSCVLVPSSDINELALGEPGNLKNYDDIDWQLFSVDFSSVVRDQSPAFAQFYLNQEAVLRDLGVPLNYTMGSGILISSGHTLLHNGTQYLSRLLDSDIPVTLVGSDYNAYFGWESQAIIADDLNYVGGHGQPFIDAGWAEFKSGNGELGGLVKQAGNLALVRVVGTSNTPRFSRSSSISTIFSRAIHHHDISTGNDFIDPTNNIYISGGRFSAYDLDVEFVARDSVAPCHLSVLERCDKDDIFGLAAGEKVVREYWVVDPNAPIPNENDDSEEDTGASTPDGVIFALMASLVASLVLL